MLLISVDFLNVSIKFSIDSYVLQSRHSIFVFSFGLPLSKPPLNTSFNSPLKKLKNKYEKTVVRPACRIANYANVIFLYYDEKRLPGSKTYEIEERNLPLNLFHLFIFAIPLSGIFCWSLLRTMHLTLPLQRSPLDKFFKWYEWPLFSSLWWSLF